MWVLGNKPRSLRSTCHWSHVLFTLAFLLQLCELELIERERKAWTEVLGSERLTGAALDRLTHRCHILETKGESYRLRDAKRRRRRTD